MEIATFQKYKNGYYSFIFEDGLQIDFEEIHPKSLYKYNLKDDKSYREKQFKLSFSEVIDKKDPDIIIYRIDNLLLL